MKTITLDTVNKRLAVIAALNDRIAKLVPMVDDCPKENASFIRMFGQEIADLKAIVADLKLV